MSSNVINLLDIKRAKAPDADGADRTKLQVQLDLPFEGALVPVEVEAPKIAGKAASHANKYMFLAFTNDFVFQDDFLNFCKAVTLDLVVDLRVAPRLDFVRPVRKLAFELFNTCGIEYRDVLGRLNAATYDLTQSRFEEVINTVESLTSHHDGRPTLGLFDNATFAQFCATKLSQALRVVTLDSDAIRRVVAEGARERL